MTKTRPRVGFIGAGRVGTALAGAFSEAGYPITSISSRSRASADLLAVALPGSRSVAGAQDVAESSDVVFLTVPDAAIRAVVDSVHWAAGACVVHTSGVESAGILESAARDGASTGGLHPLQTFAGAREPRANLPGSVFAVEAAEPLRSVLLEMVAAIDGTAVELRPEDKALYHAAAVLVSNYTVTLTKMATDLWLRFGCERPAALRALLPLLKGTVANIEALGLPQALTGPVARGDAATVERHIAALAEAAPEMLPVYRELALQTLPVALARGGLDNAAAEAIRAAVAIYNSPAALNSLPVGKTGARTLP